MGTRRIVLEHDTRLAFERQDVEGGLSDVPRWEEPELEGHGIVAKGSVEDSASAGVVGDERGEVGGGGRGRGQRGRALRMLKSVVHVHIRECGGVGDRGKGRGSSGGGNESVQGTSPRMRSSE